MIGFRLFHGEPPSYAARAILAASVLLALTGPRGADAASTGQSQNTTVTLLAEPASIQPGRPFHVGLRMRMKEGWHTYWKNPGDSGLPTSVEWTLPKGFTAGPIEWPAPERMTSGPEVSYGYLDEVLLLVLVTPPKTIGAGSITIAGKVRWLECADVCLPGSATLDLHLPVTSGGPAPGPDAAAFATARSQMPRDGAPWSLRAVAGRRAIALYFQPPKGIVPHRAYLFVDQPLVVDYAAGQPWGRVGDGFLLTASPAANATATPRVLTGVLVVHDARAQDVPIPVRVDLPVVAGDPAPFQPAPPENPFPTGLVTVIAGLHMAAIALFVRKRLQRRAAPANPPDPNDPTPIG